MTSNGKCQSTERSQPPDILEWKNTALRECLEHLTNLGFSDDPHLVVAVRIAYEVADWSALMIALEDTSLSQAMRVHAKEMLYAHGRKILDSVSTIGIDLEASGEDAILYGTSREWMDSLTDRIARLGVRYRRALDISLGHAYVLVSLIVLPQNEWSVKLKLIPSWQRLAALATELDMDESDREGLRQIQRSLENLDADAKADEIRTSLMQLDAWCLSILELAVWSASASARGIQSPGGIKAVEEHAFAPPLQERSNTSHQHTPRGSTQVHIPSPHPRADPEAAVRLNIQHQKDLKAWKSLPWWKRIREKKPEPPKGI